MALKKLDNNNYIKLDSDGSIVVYSNLEKRLKQKQATSSSLILEKYDELINAVDDKIHDLIVAHGYSEEDRANEDLGETLHNLPGMKELIEEMGTISFEKFCYQDDLEAENGATHDFLIISKFFPDIKDSIPEIIERANVVWASKSVEDVYKEAKVKSRFGETEDC